MCGIIGVINGRPGSLKANLNKFFRDALITGGVRGVDSTGVFQADSVDKVNQKVYVYKDLRGGQALLTAQDPWFDGIVGDAGKAFITIGHHRAATSGSITTDNAHPFHLYRKDRSIFVGVHNGTLDSGWNSGASKKFSVDSEYLINELSKDVEGTLEETSGAIATVFYDTAQPGKFCMYTNGARPLHFAFSEHDPHSMLIASEAGMLAWLADRNDIKLLGGKIHQCKPRFLYTFDGKHAVRSFTHKVISSKPYKAVYGPNHTSASNSGANDDYNGKYPSWTARGRIERMVNKLLADVGESVKKDAYAPAVEQAAATTAQKEPDVSEVPNKDAPHNGVKANEIALLKDMRIIPNSEVVFEGKRFVITNPKKQLGILYGDVLVETTDESLNRDLLLGVVRNVKRDEADKWMDKPAIARALGAYKVARNSEGGIDVNVVCSVPVEELKAVSH